MKNCCTELPGSDVLNWLTSEVNGILKDAPINASVRYSQYPDYVRKFNGISEVVGIVPTKDRAFGKALTFMNSEGEMELWYFKGDELSLWEDIGLWEKADYSPAPTQEHDIIFVKAGMDYQELVDIFLQGEKLLVYRPTNGKDIYIAQEQRSVYVGSGGIRFIRPYATYSQEPNQNNLINIVYVLGQPDSDGKLKFSNTMMYSINIDNLFKKTGGNISGNVNIEGQLSIFGLLQVETGVVVGTTLDEDNEGLKVCNGPIKIQDTISRTPTLRFIRGEEGDSVLDAQLVADGNYFRIQRESQGEMKDVLRVSSNRFMYKDKDVLIRGDNYTEGDTPTNPIEGQLNFDPDAEKLKLYTSIGWIELQYTNNN